VCVCVCADVFAHSSQWNVCNYGVATISRMLKNIGLFCKRDLQKRPIFCKETYIFKHPTHRSRPIIVRKVYSTRMYMDIYIYVYASVYVYAYVHGYVYLCVCICVCVRWSQENPPPRGRLLSDLFSDSSFWHVTVSRGGRNRPRTENSHLKRHELLFFRGFSGLVRQKRVVSLNCTRNEEFVAFQVWFVHFWAGKLPVENTTPSGWVFLRGFLFLPPREIETYQKRRSTQGKGGVPAINNRMWMCMCMCMCRWLRP